MTPHSSTLGWKIPWMEEPGRLRPMGSLRVGHDWATSLSLSSIGKGNGNPLQCCCLENPRDRGTWWAVVYGAQSRTRLKWLSSSSSRHFRVVVFFFNYSVDQFRAISDSFSDGSVIKNSLCSAGDAGLVPGLGRSPGGGNGKPLQYSCLEILWTDEPGRLQSMGSQKSQTLLHTHTHTHSCLIVKMSLNCKLIQRLLFTVKKWSIHLFLKNGCEFVFLFCNIHERGVT